MTFSEGHGLSRYARSRRDDLRCSGEHACGLQHYEENRKRSACHTGRYSDQRYYQVSMTSGRFYVYNSKIPHMISQPIPFECTVKPRSANAETLIRVTNESHDPGVILA